MARVTDTMLFDLIHDFFKIFLPKQKRSSKHTIRAYNTSMNQFLDFVKEKNGIPLGAITFEMLTREMVADFLDWLEESRGCSDSTRNHRLQCIRAFFKYAAEMEATAVSHQASMKKVPMKTVMESDIIDYMEPDAVLQLLNQPDTKTRMGLRDQCLMVLLYDTGARVQEILDVHPHDIRFGKTSTIILTGKGPKVRSVPLMEITVRHIRQYMKVFHPIEDPSPENRLFYTFGYGRRRPMSSGNVRRFLKSYGEQAQKVCPQVPDDVHPHLIRHSRAMHLYQQGMDLSLISQWLGHAHLKSTLVYAHADTELKRQAIQRATASHDLLRNIPVTSNIDLDDDDVIKQLYGLKRIR
jgi:site-specific recombinase XerD